MSSERTRKLIDDKVSLWDKTKVAFTPGPAHEKAQRLEQIAQDRVRQEERELMLKKLASGS